MIARAIASVVSQLPPLGDTTEFLIVDNNSEPPLCGAAYLQSVPAQIIREPIQGLMAARETAIRRARGKVVLFLDDDNILAPGYLSGVANAFDDPTLGIISGGVFPEYESTPPAWLREFEAYLAVRPYARDLVVNTTGLPYTGHFPIGAGMAIRRTLAIDYLADAEGTNRIEGRKGHALSSCEDLDLDFFALYRGYHLRVVGALRLTHVIPARRCTEAYISQLVVSTLRSCHDVERKWANRFDRTLFPVLHDRSLEARLRSVAFTLLSPLSARHRVRRRIYRETRRLRTPYRRNAVDA